jgi:hypothetical protein
MGKIRLRIRDESGSGIKSRITIPRDKIQFFELTMLKYFVADTDLGSGIFFTLDPGSKTKKSDTG